MGFKDILFDPSLRLHHKAAVRCGLERRGSAQRAVILATDFPSAGGWSEPSEALKRHSDGLRYDLVASTGLAQYSADALVVC